MALMAPKTKEFINDIKSYIDREGIDLVWFDKGRLKDDETQDRLRQWSDDKEGATRFPTVTDGHRDQSRSSSKNFVSLAQSDSLFY